MNIALSALRAIDYKLLDDDDHSQVVRNIEEMSYTFRYPTDIDFCPIYEVTLPEGRYVIEAWGGRGGDMDLRYSGRGGLGGYTKGTLTFGGGVILLTLGGKGTNWTESTPYTFGGCNGGGSAYNAAAGGGATTITLNDQIIMVAGGGGGANDETTGGSAVGAIGGNGIRGNGALGRIGMGGTQSAPGTCESNPQFNGNGPNGGSGANNDGGAGGGGYYGGAAATGFTASGGAGSSYISGHPDCPNVVVPSFKSTLMGTSSLYNGQVKITIVLWEAPTRSIWHLRRLWSLFVVISMVQ